MRAVEIMFAISLTAYGFTEECYSIVDAGMNKQRLN
jgi:hypothetical protein